MIDAFDRFEELVIAADSHKEDEPFFCPGCAERVFLKPCVRQKVVPHFSHYSKSTCKRGAGESEEHRLIKQELFRQVRKSSITTNIRLEYTMWVTEDRYRRADLYFETVDGEKYAIEVQRSEADAEGILQRTADYNNIDVWPIWLTTPERSIKPWYQDVAHKHGNFEWVFDEKLFCSRGQPGRIRTYEFDPVSLAPYVTRSGQVVAAPIEEIQFEIAHWEKRIIDRIEQAERRKREKETEAKRKEIEKRREEERKKREAERVELEKKEHRELLVEREAERKKEERKEVEWKLRHRNRTAAIKEHYSNAEVHIPDEFMRYLDSGKLTGPKLQYMLHLRIFKQFGHLLEQNKRRFYQNEIDMMYRENHWLAKKRDWYGNEQANVEPVNLEVREDTKILEKIAHCNHLIFKRLGVGKRNKKGDAPDVKEINARIEKTKAELKPYRDKWPNTKGLKAGYVRKLINDEKDSLSRHLLNNLPPYVLTEEDWEYIKSGGISLFFSGDYQSKQERKRVLKINQKVFDYYREEAPN